MLLYHATYAQRLDSIKKYGLGARQPKNWSDSEKGLIYLAQDYDIAESFCECADSVQEDVYAQGIIVLALDTSILKQQNFQIDEKARARGQDGCLVYKGTIQASKIRLVKRDSRTGKETYIKITQN